MFGTLSPSVGSDNRALSRPKSWMDNWMGSPYESRVHPSVQYHNEWWYMMICYCTLALGFLLEILNA